MAAPKRFKELVHYVCDLCDDPKKLGATKLNKALWYADTFAYRLTGKTISGEKHYVKRQFGPVPSNILTTLRQLEKEDKIRIRETEYFGRPKREFVVLERADEEIFDECERDIIRQVVSVICDDHTAASISDLSHDQIWEAAEIGEDIPVYAVLAAKAAPVTKKDETWANKIIRERHRKGGKKAASSKAA